MKLIVFCPFYPPHIGGLQNHADEFNKHLSAKDVYITVITPQIPVSAPERETKYPDVEIIRFPAFEIIHNYPLPKFWNLKFWKITTEIFNKNYDIVIARTRFFFTSFLALIYAKLKQTKFVHIEHGSGFVKLHNPITSIIARIYDATLSKVVLCLADLNIANSKAGAKFVQSLCSSQKCEVIYRGIEMDKFIHTSANIDVRNKYPNKPIITFVGRLIDGKGVQDLIQALALIENNDAMLFVIGNGSQKDYLEALAKQLNLKEKIVFFGEQPQEQVISILKASDIFVNPSYTEGLPTSVIEAAFSKLAIIATDVGDTGSIVKNDKTGYLIKPGDTNALAEKLSILLQNSELRHQMGQTAFNEAKKLFDWEQSAEKYIHLFNKLLK